ncbi:AAA family ATPase [Trinickia diaoshuihuensis]|uniref:AAA family ATPase n=1 Tax=Trinickia diaoshuihuensis TaxID=2292265 RepID=UPI000E28860E|nr:AAA family ATPase [Trinickia diaoshuihuensis]
MPAINKLTIEGYKSIRALRDLELRNLNVLIGANGAGKSNFIGFFRMLAEMFSERLQMHVQLRGGPDALLYYGRKTTDRIVAEFEFDQSEVSEGEAAVQADRYRFELEPTTDHRLVFGQEIVWDNRWQHSQSRPITFGASHPESQLARHLDAGTANPATARFLQEIVHPLNRLRVYHFHDTSDSAKVKQIHATNDTLRLKEDGANLAAWLRMLRENHIASYRAIVAAIRLVAPFFDDFVYRASETADVQLEWTERRDPDTPLKAHALSDGTLRFICLCTLLLQPWELMPPVILLDEPELGLHPYAINVLADLLQRAAEHKQLIIATQSVELINCLSVEDLIVVDRRDNASEFRRLDPDEFKTWLGDYSLGELWKQNVLGGRPA